MRPFNPRVSIVIPVFNGSNYLKEAIDSALAQTYTNLEVIVINDGSTDAGSTDEVARTYGDKIHYYVKKNGGVATALNYGIKKMTGDYFSWLSHDDMYEKSKIEEQVNLLRKFNTDDVIAACNARVLFMNGIKKNEYIDKDTFEFIDIFLSTSAVTGLNGCSLLIPKKALSDNGGFDDNLPFTQDYDLWFRLKNQYKFVLLEKNLVISRRHAGQDSIKKQKLCFEAADKLHYDFLNSVPFKRFEEFFNKSPKNIDSYLSNFRVYKASSYRKTASMMLKHLLKYYFVVDKDRFNELYSSEIGPVFNQKLLSDGKSKKRILFYSNEWHMGGIERVLSRLFDRFGNEYDCILVTNRGFNINKGFALPDSIKHFKINNSNQIAELMDLASLLDIDLFIGNPNYSESFVDIYIALEQTNTKTVAYNHGYYFLPYMTNEYLYPTALKLKEAFRAANFVVWPNQAGCNIYNIENNNGLYIANPVVIENSRPKTRTKKNILAIGRFDDETKRIDRILLIFKELYKIDSEYKLDIVGYCPTDTKLLWLENETLNAFMREQNIPISRITFLGEQADVTKFYDNAEFLIMTSRSEGFGLVLVEALSRGVPCAAFEYIGINEIVIDGYNGWICSQDDYLGMANNIVKTVENKKLYFEMSKNALNSAKKFDVNIFYEKWGKLFDVIIGTNTVTKLSSLKPDNKLTSDDYEKIILEYEKLLNVAVSNFIDLETAIENSKLHQRTRVSILTERLRTSLKTDGVYLTSEKIIRKLSKKVLKK